MNPQSRRPPHTALVLARDFLPVDAFFKVAFWWTFLLVLDLPADQRGAAIRVFVGPALLSAVGFYVCGLWALWPLERYRRGEESDDAVRAAAIAAHRAPLWVGLGVTLSYSVAFLGGALRLIYDTPEVDLPRGAVIAVLFIEATILIGATTLGYLLMMNNLARTTGALSLRLLQRGIELPQKTTTMRRSNLLYGLGVGLTPVALLTAMTVIGTLKSTRADGISRGRQAATELALRLAEGGALALPPGAQAALSLDGRGGVTARVGADVPAGLVRRAVDALTASGAAAAVDDDQQVLGVARGGGRTVAVALPNTTTAASVYWQCLIVGIFMVVFAVICARYISGNILLVVRRVARALREIAEAGGVAAGTKHIPLLARDELGVLVESANVMIDRLDGAEGAWRLAAESLREANQRLEQRVDERTAALRESNRELEENLKRLLEARSQLAAAARAAGMAEVASSVLHNVGNVLNSVNVSAGLISERLRGSRVHTVHRAVDMIPAGDEDAARFFTADSRGRALPQYLRRVGEALTVENQELLREIAFLEKNVDHIKVIVSLQQAHAKHGGLVEPLRVAELCEDALRFGLGSLEPVRLSVMRELDRELGIVADRHRLFQIVVNLVRNARDAVREGVAAPTITVRARRDGGDAIVEVIDNGCGITPDNLTRIFNLGFTTKSDGHGYGLHSSAVAAGELGGSLGVHSEGAGRGATFTLRVPRRPARGSVETAALA